MPPSPDDKLIQDAVLDFSNAVHADLPLRHFGEFCDPLKLKDAVEPLKSNVSRKLFDKVWNREKGEIVDLFKTLYRRMDKEVIAEWVKKNQQHEIQSMSYLQKWVDMLCDDFNVALESQLLLDPDIEIESFKNYIKSRRLFSVSCFDRIWKPWNAQLQEERKSKLEKYLKSKEEEMLEKQERQLERKVAEKTNGLLGDVVEIVLERSRQLKSFVNSHHGRVSNDVLKGIVEEIREYVLNGKGTSLKENREEIYIKLLDTLEDQVKFLTEELKEDMTAEEVIEYAKTLDGKLRSHCFGSGEAQDMDHDTNERQRQRVPNEQSERWPTMQDILNELEEEHQDSTDVEENMDGMNNCTSVEPGQSAEKNKTRPPRRLLKGSVKNTGSDSNDSTIVGAAPATYVPPTKKLTTGRDVRKTTGRIDGDTHRRSSRLRLKNATARASGSYRKRNYFHVHTEKRCSDSDVAEKLGSDIDETLNSNCEDDEIVQGNNMMRTTSSPPRNFSTDKGSKEVEVCLSGAVLKPDSSMTTRKAGRCSREASSEEPQVQFNSVKSKRRKICRSHDKMCPNQITIVNGDYPKYSCDVCKTEFKNRKYLKRHVECGKVFLRKDYLVKHILVHTGEKRYQCSKCPERFTQKAHLQGHNRRCDANKNRFICKPCNLRFVSNKRFHAHNLETHDAKLPFACTYCENRFKYMASLRNHIIIHGDERPFRCPECDTTFAKMESLPLHIQRTHGHQKQKAQQLAYDASVSYLLKETKNGSYRDFPASRINSTVVNYVIKKAKLQLPDDIAVANARHKKS